MFFLSVGIFPLEHLLKSQGELLSGPFITICLNHVIFKAQEDLLIFFTSKSLLVLCRHGLSFSLMNSGQSSGKHVSLSLHELGWIMYTVYSQKEKRQIKDTAGLIAASRQTLPVADTRTSGLCSNMTWRFLTAVSTLIKPINQVKLQWPTTASNTEIRSLDPGSADMFKCHCVWLWCIFLVICWWLWVLWISTRWKGRVNSVFF